MTDDFYARDRAVTEAARGNSPAAQALRQAQNDQWKLEHGGLTAGQVEAYRAELGRRIAAFDRVAANAANHGNRIAAISYRGECGGLQMALTLLNQIDVPLSHPTAGADQKTSSVSEAIAATNDTMRQLRDAG